MRRATVACNPDGTTHWTATVRNNGSCTATNRWQANLQQQRNGCSFQTVQQQDGVSSFPPGDTVLSGDFCASCPANTTQIRIAFKLKGRSGLLRGQPQGARDRALRL